MSNPYDFSNPDDDLAFSIDMELSRLKLPGRESKAETRDSVSARRTIIARAIVKAIKRANWTFARGPVSRGHSTS